MREKQSPHIEEAQVLSVTALLKTRLAGRYSLTLDIAPPAVPWATQFHLRLDEMAGVVDIRYEIQIDGIWDIVDDTIQLEATTPTYGGRRWWFLCPVTRRRAAKLYLFKGLRTFCCRTGIDPPPTYMSQRVWGMDKVYRRMHVLRQRLPEQGTILQALRRPRGMHLRTYLRLIERDAAIWNSPQNTLLAWHRKHG